MPLRSLTCALSLLCASLAAAPVLVLASPGVARAQAARDAQAEGFVSTQAQRALALLNDQSLSRAQKAARFRTFMDQVADVPRITQYVLGKYNRTATPAQKRTFAQVFREYASGVYESRLGDYRGETFRVTGSVVRRPGDVIVSSLVTGGQLREPQTVRWRVVRSGLGWRLVDVEVLGVWLAVAQQQDFTRTVDDAGGNIDVLIRQLQAEVARRGRT